MKNTIIAKDKEHLKLLIKQAIHVNGYECNLNHIDTSQITDMSFLFEKALFNGDISQWNISKVTNISGMFFDSSFNGDIFQWDVSSVTDMSQLFFLSKFNGDISHWDVSNVTDMHYMFTNSTFNGDISQWNISNVKNMHGIFTYCPCETPWWGIEDNQKRKIAINNYQLMQKLNNKLTDKQEINIPKKNKI